MEEDASLTDGARILNTSIKVASDKRSEKFNIQAAEVLFDGFLKLYIEGADDEADSEENTILPALDRGTPVNAVSPSRPTGIPKPRWSRSSRNSE